jgi:hypothetical protein
MQLGAWRDVALILLILETMLVVLPTGILLYLAVRAAWHVRRQAKDKLPIARGYAERMVTITDGLSRRIVRPLIEVRARSAQLDAVGRAALKATHPRRDR